MATFLSMQVTRNSIVTLFLLAASLLCQAQQQPSFSQYMYNTLSFNPAYAGYHLAPEVNVSARGQFSGIEGAPRSLTFAAHGRALSNRTGLGFLASRDEIGVSNTTEIQGSYSFRLISRNKNSYSSWSYIPKVLSLGLSAGISRYHEGLTSLSLSNDPNFKENVTHYVPNFGVGIYYSKHPFYVGLSIPQLLGGIVSKKLNFRRHIYLNGGVYLNTGTFTTLQLSTLVKYVQGAPLQADVNAIMILHDKVEVGAGFRSVSTLNIMAGLRISDKLRLAYFYDFPLGTNRQISFNTHEIMLNYRFLK